MFSHITLGTNDIGKAIAFYNSVLATLGMERRYTNLEYDFAGYGEKGGKPQVFICKPFDEAPATHGNGTHIALLAPSRKMVDAFHVAALAAGGSDEGAPGPRPQYHEHYYGAYVRDLDGNKLQACCHDPE
jgi:catechol 2,3-dioxygenase-like lactoylglutathione lyase family enzyme